MVLGCKLAHELSLLLPLVELGSNHFRDKLLCFDERNLYVSMWVAVERKLTGNSLWQRFEGRPVFC